MAIKTEKSGKPIFYGGGKVTTVDQELAVKSAIGLVVKQRKKTKADRAAFLVKKAERKADRVAQAAELKKDKRDRKQSKITVADWVALSEGVKEGHRQAAVEYRRKRKTEKRKASKARKRLRDNQRYASGPQRLLILKRDSNQCRYCGIEVTNETANMDHVKPWKFGGLTTFENLVTCCQDCNKAKGNKRIGWEPT